jgi:hypothetical protein
LALSNPQGEFLVAHWFWRGGRLAWPDNGLLTGAYRHTLILGGHHYLSVGHRDERGLIRVDHYTELGVAHDSHCAGCLYSEMVGLLGRQVSP